jgi:DNA-binding PadR family transcriptional regulator
MRTTHNTPIEAGRPDRDEPRGEDRGGGRRHHGGFGGPDRGFGGRREERGFGSPFGGARGQGPRARKGDVRAAILSLLADTPSNGYGLIKAIDEKTDGAWRPSPGSVYPTLAQLVDEELIAPTGAVGPRSDYQLTDAGRSYISEHVGDIAAAWSAATGDHSEREPLIGASRKLMGAIRQFSTEATVDQRQQAVAKLDEVRRELYRILGE